VDEREPLKAEIVDDVPNSGRNSGSQWNGLASTEPTALAALALAIASWVAIPIIGAIAALLIAPAAKRRIRRSNGEFIGTSLATAAQVISALNLILGIFVVWVIYRLLVWIF
jgi:hypothetical protein